MQQSMEIKDLIAAGEKLSDHWDWLTQNGICIFDFVFSGKNLEELFEYASDRDATTDHQQCYMGYNPENESFITGFDMWPDGNEIETCLVEWRLNPNTRSIEHISDDEAYYSGFYGNNGLYDCLSRNYPKIIDIQLK